MKKKLKIFLLFLLFTSFYFLFSHQSFAQTPCCQPPNLKWDEASGKCRIVGGHGGLLDISCNPAMEVCINNVCQPLNTSPPPGSACGYLNQQCCTPNTGKRPCMPGYKPNKTINNISDYQNCLCISSEESSKSITLLEPKDCGKCLEHLDTAGHPCIRWWGIQTALGCFPTQPKDIVAWVLQYAVILGGGIAFLMMLYGAFQIIISTGDPEKLKQGQQVLGSAISGLMLIIFAVFLLRLIGFTILKIPGWK